jgi:hypothetical protein
MLNPERNLATDSMQLAADAFRPPAAKPFSLWAIVGCITALVLATDFVHTALRQPAPTAQEVGKMSKSGEQNSRGAIEAPDLRAAGIFEHHSPPQGIAVEPAGTPVNVRPRSRHASECATLDQEVQSLSAAARVLLTPQQQDTIRASQANAKSRRRALDC